MKTFGQKPKYLLAPHEGAKSEIKRNVCYRLNGIHPKMNSCYNSGQKWWTDTNVMICGFHWETTMCTIYWGRKSRLWGGGIQATLPILDNTMIQTAKDPKLTAEFLWINWIFSAMSKRICEVLVVDVALSQWERDQRIKLRLSWATPPFTDQCVFLSMWMYISIYLDLPVACEIMFLDFHQCEYTN